MLRTVREIQDTHRVWSMHIRKALTPVCPICRCCSLLCFEDSASPQLHFCEIAKSRRIGQTRKVGELANMKLFLSLAIHLLLRFTNGQCAYFCPLFMCQRNHRAIYTQCTSLQVILLVFLFRFRRFSFHRLCLLHPLSCSLTQSAHCLLIGLYSKQPLGHACCLVKGHPTRKMNHVFLLAGSHISGQQS